MRECDEVSWRRVEGSFPNWGQREFVEFVVIFKLMTLDSTIAAIVEEVVWLCVLCCWVAFLLEKVILIQISRSLSLGKGKGRAVRTQTRISSDFSRLTGA